MTLIDQRILIDAPPHVVWNHIADPNEVRRWHTGYRTISVLTTQQTGLGTRRRCTPTAGGKDVIEEITAWVEGLGYEYTQVEGGAYRSMRARIRLQPGPDGTIVQWTVTYKPRGMVGIVRDLFGGKRDMQIMMAESLRALRRQIDDLGLRMDADYRERVSMRGRLNHDQRQQYLSRQAGEDMLPGTMPIDSGADGDEVPAEPVQEMTPPVAVPEVILSLEDHDEDEHEPVDAAIPAPAQITPPGGNMTAGEAVPTPAQGLGSEVPSFVGDLLRDAGDAEDAEDVDYSHTADTDPKPPEGLREALTEADLEAPDSARAHDEAERVARDTQELIHPSVLPSALPDAGEPAPQRAQNGERVLPSGPPVPPRPVPEGVPAPSKAPTRPLDANKEPLADVPGSPDGPDAHDLDQHTRPTPARGIPSVRSQLTMTPVEPVDKVPASPVKPIASSAPTPAHGTPILRRAASAAPGTQPPVRAAHLPPPTPQTDTGEMSIWEVFGTQRPSEHDAHALEDLIQSVTARETAEIRRRTRWARRPARVRYMQMAVGLRVRIGMQLARVRARRVRRLRGSGK